MFVRLAFSAAIYVDPDILIIDEALAVGDVKFQNKCYRKFNEFRDQGKTIIFVTHSTDLIAKLCNRAILLHNGHILEDNLPNLVINRYLELLLGSSDKNIIKEENSVGNTKEKTTSSLIEIINKKDPTYSPLSLYFIIDNNLVSDQVKINSLFDILIEDTSLDTEIKNLIIYKKALYNADNTQESDLLNMIKPLINSQSIWKSHSLYLMAEYFYANNQKQKAKEFFNQIIDLENSNPDIRLQAEKRLNRDLSE